MRRVVILALLALALPIVASAGTIDIVNKNGSISITSSGISSVGGQLWQYDGISTGHPMGTVSFSTGVCLSGCNGSGIPGSNATFSDAGSSFTVVCGQAACGGNHLVLFQGSFVGPITWTQTGFGATQTYELSGAIQGMLANGHFVTGETTQTIYTNAGQLALGIGHIRVGNSQLVVPEPGTLSLLGTGLVGIAGLLRRKFLTA